MRLLCLGVLAALLGAAAQVPNLDFITQSDGTKCGLTGTAHKEELANLDKKKNRYHPPANGEIDKTVTLAAMVGPGDDVNRFDDTKAATVIGFVQDVKVGGKESCNCGATAAVDRDTHIELGLGEGNIPENQRVIVEITPRIRLLNPDKQWETDALKNPKTGIKGKWVKVTGWLLFDVMHIDEAENTGSGVHHIWRATCWEIHPVTSLEVLSGPPGDLPAFHPHFTAEFQRAQRAQLSRSPERLKEIKERNEKIESVFGKEADEEIGNREPKDKK